MFMWGGGCGGARDPKPWRQSRVCQCRDDCLLSPPVDMCLHFKAIQDLLLLFSRELCFH